ncbi:aldehyde dehydrogenase family protein [Pseudogemmobacter humi]|uniref:NAD/NADP-dependent betaine aldehyde dehydrogenase n=1 Tax=Pseudogemmobacter humi TaxID=2483812 RepID=A0A3P5X4Z7_9RHOB|nr:aldehyde dehydrogenase family protein [Pseudogemmobacter humi]VDC22344.1 NAD/NADP-dependent betaine aldehyde dehydrogenase [Pseudogemmobacter humi]
MNLHDHWIDGVSVAPADGARLERVSPADGRVIAAAALGTAGDLDAAVVAARRAFDTGPWTTLPGSQRGEVLLRLAALIEENLEALAFLEAEEAGKPLAVGRSELQFGIELIRYAASLASGLSGRLLSESGPEAMGLVLQQPLGVIGVICPWNYPAVCLLQKLPFALAAGCAVVAKPSELTAGTTVQIARLAREAGLPDGQFNVVIGTGEVVGEAMTAHPGIDKISFTGSGRIGRRIAAKCGESLKRYSLELGGKGANIIFADADLDAAVEGAFQGFTINKGEECCAGSRILVEESIAGDFTARLLARCAAARLGGVRDEEAEIGPLIHEQHLQKVLSFIEGARADGARLLCGGERLTGGDYAKGTYLPPTIFTDVRPDMTLFREEVFGPVAALMTFRTLDEAVQIANDTTYGLANGIWTGSLDKAMAMTRRLQSGMLYVNTYLELVPQLPFGGMKSSGMGHENGPEGLQEFLTTRSAFIRLRTAF